MVRSSSYSSLDSGMGHYAVPHHPRPRPASAGNTPTKAQPKNVQPMTNGVRRTVSTLYKSYKF